MPETLLINACARENSRTLELANYVLDKIGGSFEELREILDRVDRPERVGVCLDTCHVHDAGYDIVGDLDGVLTRFDKVVGLDRLKALHINDSMNVCGARKDRHQKLGEGHIGPDAIVRVVTHPALQGRPMSLETPNDLDGYAAEIRLLRELSGEQKERDCV